MIWSWLVLAGLVTVAWRTRPAARKAKQPPVALGEAEARAILGVSAGAGPESIRSAWRRMAAKAHPDAGGSTDLARRVNAARDVLLRRTP